MTNTTTPEIGMARLKATLEKLQTLEESAFNYSSFVTQYEKSKNCPTIACVAGYLPAWFEDTPFSYERFGDLTKKSNVPCLVYENMSTLSIEKGLRKYYGCSDEIVGALFFGHEIDGIIGNLDPDFAFLGAVIIRFQIVIYMTEKQKIRWN